MTSLSSLPDAAVIGCLRTSLASILCILCVFVLQPSLSIRESSLGSFSSIFMEPELFGDPGWKCGSSLWDLPKKQVQETGSKARQTPPEGTAHSVPIHLPAEQNGRPGPSLHLNLKSHRSSRCFMRTAALNSWNPLLLYKRRQVKKGSPHLESFFINCKPFYSVNPMEFSSFILVGVYIPPS
ncbi:hypothetical protein ILYODFUR_028867 [Ilyodon furcidens]|uniref:Uncharacterized protein n=1 Tax=Ilyodon furcidens TaxID=33524 RepID=A0ABV0TBW9_9TELE